MNSETTLLFEAIDEGLRRLDTAVAAHILSPAEAKKRAAYLNRVRENYSRSVRLQQPKVFISFAGASGEAVAARAYAAVRKTSACPFGPKFEVENGMRQSGHPEVMRHIKLHLGRSCVFLGIMTAEAALASADQSGSYAPGAWVLIEAGMANALDIPCVLLVEDTVHESYWKDQLGSWRHVRFSRKSLDGDLHNAMGRLQEHYEAECRKRL